MIKMKQLFVYFIPIIIFNSLINNVTCTSSGVTTTTTAHQLIDNNMNIQQCTVELLNSKTTNLFEILYNKPNAKLIIILNKYKLLAKSQATYHHYYYYYEMNILCAYNVDIIRLNIKLEILDEDLGNCRLSLDDRLVDSKMIRIDRNVANSQVIYSIDYQAKHVDDDGSMSNQQQLSYQRDDLMVEAESSGISQLTFIEKYLLKQDKLNNTIWIYEELALNSIIGYLQISVNLSAFVSTIKTNLNSHVETFVGSLMTFQLVKIFNDEKNNLYALTILKRIDREYIDYYDLAIDLKSESKSIETLQLRVCLIDINDNTPVFKTIYQNGSPQNVTVYKFNVTENHVYYNFAQIYATDRDLGLNAEVEYEVLGIEKHVLDTQSNQLEKIDEPLFRINVNTGYLSLMKKLDREDGDFYRLTIRASDRGKSIKQRSIGIVEIEVVDENDNAPKFHHNRTYKFKIRENMQIRTQIGNCKAYDSDKNAKTVYYFEPKYFETLFGVDSQTGDLYSKQVFDADIGDNLRDNETNVYKFKIFAKDADRDDSFGLLHDHISVDVKLEDVNDNEPYLKQTETNFMLNLNNRYNKTIVKLVPVDNDFTRLPVNFQILFIRKMNFNFLNDILKQQHHHDNDDNKTQLILNFITSLKNRYPLTDRVQKFEQNLSSLFSFNKKENTIEFEADNYRNYFTDGLYNITIKITDSKILSNDYQFSKQISLKIFLFNHTIVSPAPLNETADVSTPLEHSQFEHLLNIVEKWHEAYFKEDWTSEYEANYVKSAGILNEFYTSDNTEYILENSAHVINSSDCLLNNLIYYRFDYNIFSASGGSAIKDFYRYTRINSSGNREFSNLNSNLIIGTITLFVVIAIFLFAIMAYKNVKSTHCPDDKSQQGGGESKKNSPFDNDDSVDNTSSNSSDKSFIPTITNSVSTSSIKKSVIILICLLYKTLKILIKRRKKKLKNFEDGCIQTRI